MGGHAQETEADKRIEPDSADSDDDDDGESSADTSIENEKNDQDLLVKLQVGQHHTYNLCSWYTGYTHWPSTGRVPRAQESAPGVQILLAIEDDSS